jgi:hypothetical protein
VAQTPEAALPPAIIAAGIGAAGAIGGGLIASSGASKAAKAQTTADQAAIAEQQRQFDITNANLSPFRQAGLGALDQYGNLVGTNGNPAQDAAIQSLMASPYYQSLYRNGLTATLQNASATGGLRGGNTQTGLANFGADTLAQTIQQQLGNLGSLAGLGYNAATATGQFGANAANNISNLTVQQGQANSDAALAQAGALSGIFKNLGSIGGIIANPSAFGLGSSGIGSSGGIRVTPNWDSNASLPIGGF